jgi:HK97 family phage prohead protease
MSKRKTQPSNFEHRTFSFSVRREGDGGALRLVGHAAVFNQMTVLVPKNAWYEGSPEIREVIEPGAFAKTITERDVRALWNHNSDVVLGRKENKTLFLREDERGLHNEILPPDTALVRDMCIAPIERGDVDQMSFGFRIIRDKFEEENGVVTITLKELDLVEVSPCTIPQYTGTDIGLSARSVDRLEDFRQQRQAAIQPPAPVSEKTRDGHPEPEPPIATPDTANHPEQQQRSAPDATLHLEDEDMFSQLEILRRKIAA